MTLFEVLVLCGVLSLMMLGLLVTRCWNPELGMLIAGGPFAIGAVAAMKQPDPTVPVARWIRR
ncbi:MAG: hypothetical protein QM831_32275 [Kofleriaceae bacterium]